MSASMLPGRTETTGGAIARALDTIQHSFGHHDLSSVKAHVGGPAAAASHQLGAQAYATGNDVDWYLELGFKAFKVTNPAHYEQGIEGIDVVERKIALARETVGPRSPSLLVTSVRPDSTALRNLGAVFGYLLIGFQSTLKGLERITLNVDVIADDVADNPELVAEAMRRAFRHGLEVHQFGLQQDRIQQRVDAILLSPSGSKELVPAIRNRNGQRWPAQRGASREIP